MSSSMHCGPGQDPSPSRLLARWYQRRALNYSRKLQDQQRAARAKVKPKARTFGHAAERRTQRSQSATRSVSLRASVISTRIAHGKENAVAILIASEGKLGWAVWLAKASRNWARPG